MNPMLMSMMMVLAVLASCTHRSGGAVGGGAPVSGYGALHKVEGPPIERLSAEQIEQIDQTCFHFHNLADERVPYTERYCERIDQERNRRAMTVKGARAVILKNPAVGSTP
jgi:hypothetical protein